MEQAVSILDSVIKRFNPELRAPLAAIDELNDSFLVLSFEDYISRKREEMNASNTWKRPPLSQFGIDDFSSFDWNNWPYFRQHIFSKLLSFYITDFCDYLCCSISHSNSIFISEIIPRTKNMLYKTNIGGKLNRGLLHILSFKLLRETKQKTSFSSIDAHNALILCLMIEALQSYFLVMDDVMDESLTRRGSLCWYKQPNIGLKAINDGPIIESWIFWLIHNRLIVDNIGIIHLIDGLFRKTIIETQFGQMIDLELTSSVLDLKTMYTQRRYESIAKFKTSFYTFYCPYASALYLAGYNDKNNSDLFMFYVSQQLSIKMGINFQIVDDYLDVYGDYNVMGKIGTDIEDFKCSWLLVKALQICNEKQYKILHNNYGKNNNESIQNIKDLYNELNLKKIFEEWQNKANQELLKLVDSIDDDILPKQMFTVIINKLYKRNK